MPDPTTALAALEQEPIGPIDHVDLLIVRLPFVAPFGISTYTWSVKEALLVRLEAAGVVGWGECVADPDPFYSPETVPGARYIVKEFLLPLLQPEATLGEVERGFAKVRGNAMARATVENALLDLIGRRSGRPLYAMLGQEKRRIPSGISIGLQESVDKLLAAVEEAVEKGYHRVKMKIMHGKDVDWVRAVRRRFPDIALMVDANGDYALADADHLAELDEFGLTMIEQPLGYSDIFQHARLQPKLATALCLDESIHDLDDAAAALDLHACRVINIKQGRVGGVLAAARMARLCAARGVPVWSGGMDETGIGRAVNIHLQTMPEFSIPGDTSETSRYFTEDIVDPPVVLDAEGFIAVPDGPGFGATVLEDRVARFTLDRERVR